MLFSLLSGSVTLSLHDLLNAPFAGEKSLQLQIIREIRLPRTVAAFLVGGLLSLSGVIMQILLRNSLACLLYTSPSPRDVEESRMPSSA